MDKSPVFCTSSCGLSPAASAAKTSFTVRTDHSPFDSSVKADNGIQKPEFSRLLIQMMGWFPLNLQEEVIIRTRMGGCILGAPKVLIYFTPTV